MKKVINRTLMAMLAMLPFLTACQSDPEVGTLLYPVEEEDMSPKVYVYNTSIEGNVMQSTLVNTPAGLIVPENILNFHVQLSKPVDQDVKVTVSLDKAKAAEYDETAETLDADALTLLTSEVTIPAGKTISTEEIVVEINGESSSIKSFEKYAVAAIVLNTNNVSVSEKYGTYIWKLYKETLNIYEEVLVSSNGTFEGLTEIPKSDWTLNVVGGDNYVSEMTDGVISSYNYGGVSTTGSMTYEFAAPRTVKAFACLPPAVSYYLVYGIGKLRVETSDDGAEWTSHGTVDLTRLTALSNWNVVFFYAPVTAKYFRYLPLLRANGGTGMTYVGEMKIYE